MARKKVIELSEEEKALVIEQTSALQQRLVEILLTGKSIAEAARVLRISRRTATYWMQEDSICRFAYERERQRAATEFRERIAKLHDLTLTALEDALSSEADPILRLNVAKFLYSSNLIQYGTLAIAPLANAESLVDDVIDDAKNKRLFGKNAEAEIHLYVEDDD